MATESATAGVLRRGAWLRGAGLLLGLALGLPLAAQPVGDREMQVEAAFLVNFVRYAEWPRQRFSSPQDPYVIAVVGSDTAADTIAAIARAAGPIQGRRLEVVRVELGAAGSDRRRAAVERLRGSHVAFLPAHADATRSEFLRAVAGVPVLTVSNLPDFASGGGMLGLVRAGPRMAFEANPAAMQASGVSLSAKVLKLARIREGAR